MPRAQIATKQTMHTLIQLHAELGGKIDYNKREAERLAASMKHLEAVIHMISPDYDIRRIAVKRCAPANNEMKPGMRARTATGRTGFGG